MNTFNQWIQQHNFLLLAVTLLSGSLALLSWLRWWTKRVIMVWSGLLIVIVILLFGLRTPSATVSEVVDNGANSEGITDITINSSLPSTDTILDFSSIVEIEAYLQGDKPTLVEFYADYGIS